MAPMHARWRKAAFHEPFLVVQICNLLYRRIVFCTPLQGFPVPMHTPRRNASFVEFSHPSKIDTNARLENEEMAVVDPVRDVPATGVEHPSNVGMEVPVHFAHQQAHSASAHVSVG